MPTCDLIRGSRTGSVQQTRVAGLSHQTSKCWLCFPLEDPSISPPLPTPSCSPSLARGYPLTFIASLLVILLHTLHVARRRQLNVRSVLCAQGLAVKRDADMFGRTLSDLVFFSHFHSIGLSSSVPTFTLLSHMLPVLYVFNPRSCSFRSSPRISVPLNH